MTLSRRFSRLLIGLTIAIIGFLGASPPAVAQTSFAFEYSLKNQTVSPFVVPAKVFTLTEVPVLKTVDISPFLGTVGGTGRPMVGWLASKSFRVAKEMEGIFGVTWRVVQKQTPEFGGIVFGGRITFKT